jgi:molybdopterin converting factor small subunit
MKVKLVAYGIAREILNTREMNWSIASGYSIAHLKQELIEKYPTFGKLSKLSFAVDEEYRDDSFLLNDGVEVVIIPPVSGG